MFPELIPECGGADVRDFQSIQDAAAKLQPIAFSRTVEDSDPAERLLSLSFTDGRLLLGQPCAKEAAHCSVPVEQRVIEIPGDR